jgi:hypothetical protein
MARHAVGNPAARGLSKRLGGWLCESASPKFAKVDMEVDMEVDYWWVAFGRCGGQLGRAVGAWRRHPSGSGMSPFTRWSTSSNEVLELCWERSCGVWLKHSCVDLGFLRLSGGLCRMRL